uniref:Zinc finger GRF-type domain-containing protein n=1 Tax=Lactuca sativa TaxID=4236 RepID=A0A9R1XFY7_LACSA|nr:hypothetical protein LSAT_V11C400166260 [Lactuca sativa]
MEHPHLKSFHFRVSFSRANIQINVAIVDLFFQKPSHPDQESDELKTCGCDKPTKERTSWKYHNLGRRFWNCHNSLTMSYLMGTTRTLLER